MDTKRCTTCGEEKSPDGFHKAGKSKDGLTTRCKDCSNIATRAYYAANRERLVEYARQYRAENPEAIKTQRAEFREANRGRLRGQYRATYQKHRESRIAGVRAWRQIHADYPAAWFRSYRKTEQGNAIVRACSARKGARKRGALGADYTTTEHIAARHELWGHRCYVCGKAETKMERLETDHVKPIAKGGAHLPCNLRPICKSCNSRKRAQWPYEPALRRTACAT